MSSTLIGSFQNNFNSGLFKTSLEFFFFISLSIEISHSFNNSVNIHDILLEQYIVRNKYYSPNFSFKQCEFAYVLSNLN